MVDVPRCSDCPPHGCASGRCLAAYAPNQAAMSAALDPYREDDAVLNVVTMPLPHKKPHVGGYLCDCEDCIRKNVTPIQRDKPQPWHLQRAA